MFAKMQLTATLIESLTLKQHPKRASEESHTNKGCQLSLVSQRRGDFSCEKSVWLHYPLGFLQWTCPASEQASHVAAILLRLYGDKEPPPFGERASVYENVSHRSTEAQPQGLFKLRWTDNNLHSEGPAPG